MEVLGASNRTRVISSLKRNKGWLNVQNKTEKRAAVLVPLLIERSEPSILFTVRSTLLSRHKGQVRYTSLVPKLAINTKLVPRPIQCCVVCLHSFPGGLADSTDVSATETALREAEEELGIPQNAVDIWGELKSFPDRVSLDPPIPVVCTSHAQFEVFAPAAAVSADNSCDWEFGTL